MGDQGHHARPGAGGVLALGRRHQEEDAGVQGGQGVVTLARADQQGVGPPVVDGEAVGAGDGEPVAAGGDAAGGVAAGVDQAQPDPPAGPVAEDLRAGCDAAVDQAVGSIRRWGTSRRRRRLRAAGLGRPRA
ncbi:hypothetical protein GCM10010389_64820 [Streptomyces echinoruber]|uniref:Uncharacterized protein n=1 Tax=Streptomyces echinoruber TaxID=68898 RepID=A0A918S2E9_9ACTN|nr:hypothetical protein GCM10010389_64820 [Streptomyces echinoruber]